MNPSHPGQLSSNPAEAIQGVPERIVVCRLVHFYKADTAYGNGVAKKPGLDMKK
jgi:catalase